jgi:hypothetical protein
MTRATENAVTRSAPVSRSQVHRDPAVVLVEELFGADGHLPAAMTYLLRFQTRGTPRQDLEEARWHIEQAIENIDELTVRSAPAADLVARMSAACDLPHDVVSAIEHIVAAATVSSADDALEQLLCAGNAIDDAIVHHELLPSRRSRA